jgi:hypothetical protein
MHESPSVDALLVAVSRFLREVAVPGLTGQAAFHARVAANAVELVRREIQQRPSCDTHERALLLGLLGRDCNSHDSLADLNKQLCEAIRAGALTPSTPGLMDGLQAQAAMQLAIDQPGYSSLSTLIQSRPSE